MLQGNNETQVVLTTCIVDMVCSLRALLRLVSDSAFSLSQKASAQKFVDLRPRSQCLFASGFREYFISIVVVVGR